MSPILVVVHDPELLSKLATADGPIFFLGPDGQCVRVADPAPPGQLPTRFRSPLSDEEFEERRKRPSTGITLAEFWKKVERGEWK